MLIAPGRNVVPLLATPLLSALELTSEAKSGKGIPDPPKPPRHPLARSRWKAGRSRRLARLCRVAVLLKPKGLGVRV